MLKFLYWGDWLYIWLYMVPYFDFWICNWPHILGLDLSIL